VSSIAGGVTPSQRPTASGRPSESPTETAAPIPSESSGPTESPEQSPSEIEPPRRPRPKPSPTLSFSPSPVESFAIRDPVGSPTATESAAATESSSSSWIWIVLAVLIVGGIVCLGPVGEGRGQRTAAWRRVPATRSPRAWSSTTGSRPTWGAHVADDRLDESLAEVDRIGQQLNALTVDAPTTGRSRRWPA